MGNLLVVPLLKTLSKLFFEDDSPHKVICSVNRKTNNAVVECSDKLCENEHSQGDILLDLLFKFSQKLYETSVSHVGHSNNVIMSPFSILIAISIMALGARGSTRDQIERAMNLSLDNPGWCVKLANVIKEFPSSHSSVMKQSVNEILVSKDFRILPEFINSIASIFHAAVQEVDFGNAEKIRQKVNERIGDLTHEMIMEALPVDSVFPDTKLIVSNALFFKGEWLHRFAEKNLVKPFFLDRYRSVEVPLMYQLGTFLVASFRDLDAQTLFLPYKDNRHGMLLILPRKTDGLEELQRQLFASSYAPKTFLNKMVSSQVMLFLPKFKIQFKTHLNEILSKMGVADMFESHADLSGISPTLCAETSKVVSVFHDSVIEVDEGGTKAAAATTATVMIISTPLQYTFTHPFMFYVIDLENDSIPLFIDKVVDPRS